MEDKEKRESKESTEELDINLNQLEGGTVQIDLNRLQEEEDQFEIKVIHAQKEFSFGNLVYKKVVDGFTEGALKNIIVISESRIRLYMVTADSIDILSSSEIPKGLIEGPFGTRRYESYHIDPKNKGQIQLFIFDGNLSMIIKFDYKTGDLLELKPQTFWRDPEIKWTTTIRVSKPKNSRIESFISTTLFEKKTTNYSEFAKLRDQRIRRWMNFELANANMFRREISRFRSQLMKLRADCRMNHRLVDDFSDLKVFEYCPSRPGLPHLALLINQSNMALTFRLVDLGRRMTLKTNTVNLIDILGRKWIESMRDEALRESGLENETGRRFRRSDFRELKLIDCLYLKRTKSVIVLIRYINFEIRAKIESVFHRAELKDLRYAKYHRCTSDNILKNFGEDQVLALHTGQVKNLNYRPLALVHPQTLQDYKIPGLEESKEFSVMTLSQNSPMVQHEKLSDHRILIRGVFSAFIYDWKEKAVIAQQRLAFQEYSYSHFSSLKLRDGSIYVKGNGNFFHVLRTKKGNKNLKEVAEEAKAIHLNDLFDNIHHFTDQHGYKLFQLPNNNLLYIGSTIFQGENPDQGLASPFWIEIDINTLEPVKWFSKDLQASIYKGIDPENIELIGDYFLFNAFLKRAQRNEATSRQSDRCRLVVSSKEFELIDYSSPIAMKDWPLIRDHSGTSIISFGQNNRLYLHHFDQKRVKLTLERTVKLPAEVFLIKPPSFNGGSIFGCVAQYHLERFYQSIKFLLIFDMNLNLVEHRKLRLEHWIYFPYFINAQRMAFYHHNQQLDRNVVSVLDLNEGVITLAHPYAWKSSRPNFLVEKGSGRVFCLDLDGETIKMVFLN